MGPADNIPPRALKRLLEKLRMTRQAELSCDDCFALLDVFAELVISGADADELMPLVQQHVDVCADCREEFDALVDALLMDQE